MFGFAALHFMWAVSHKKLNKVFRFEAQTCKTFNSYVYQQTTRFESIGSLVKQHLIFFQFLYEHNYFCFVGTHQWHTSYFTQKIE